MSNPDFEDLGDFDEAIEAVPEPEAAAPSKKAARLAAREAKNAEKKAAQAARSAARTAARNAAAATSPSVAAAGTSRLEFLKTLTVYDAMLIASALAISLAILLMFLELMSFESGIFYQWRTTEAFANPITPP